MNQIQSEHLDAIGQALRLPNLKAEALTPDGSSRAYYRLISQSKPHLVLMRLAGEDRTALAEDRYDWIGVQKFLYKNKFHVPGIVLTLPEWGYIVTTDFGDVTLESFTHSANNKAIRDAYDSAIDAICRFQSLRPDATEVWAQRAFDFEKFYYELNFFRTHLLEPFELIARPEIARFDEEILELARSAASHSRVFTHRDFHSRNLMMTDKGLGIIDFQDARIGPQTYDLVSLIFDSYVDFNENERLAMFADGLAQLTNPGSEWPAVLCQRQLKALGSFGYLTNTVKRGNYLSYVEGASKSLLYCQKDLKAWPFIAETLLPRLEQFGKTTRKT